METTPKVRVAALQASFGSDLHANVAKIVGMVRSAAGQGAQIILPPELFQGPYFCQEEHQRWFDTAWPTAKHPAVRAMQEVARELGVIIPTSFFEEDGNHYYNSLAMIDVDGSIMGVYRKSHIPDGPGYEEKFYFRAGNTGFKVWDTCFGKLGVGICWDQWFPECARAMLLQGAEILFYPTAIGSEPEEPGLDTKDLWQRAMVGHAVSNVVPIVAANRFGDEGGQLFYGHSFITDHRGDKLAEAPRDAEAVLTADFDLRQIRRDRASFGFFRDRRPELYRALTDSA